MRALLFALLATAASAQVLPPETGDALAMRLPSNRCDAAALMPTLDLNAGMAGVMPEVAATGGGLAPTPMPNLCAELLAVLPEGVQFRLDPLPPSSRDDLGRQFLREQEFEREVQQSRYLFQALQLGDEFRQQVGHLSSESLLRAPLVAPGGNRP